MTDWKVEIRRRLADLNLPPAREVEIIEELSQHIEDCYIELLGCGATPGEAARAALAELSDYDLVRQLGVIEPQVSKRRGAGDRTRPLPPQSILTTLAM